MPSKTLGKTAAAALAEALTAVPGLRGLATNVELVATA